MSFLWYPSYLCFRSWVKWNKTSQWLLWAMCMYTTSVFHGKSCIPGTWIHTWLGFESMMEWNWISTQIFWFLLETRHTEKGRSCITFRLILQPGLLGPQLYDVSQRAPSPRLGWSNQWPGLWSTAWSTVALQCENSHLCC